MSEACFYLLQSLATSVAKGLICLFGYGPPTR